MNAGGAAFSCFVSSISENSKKERKAEQEKQSEIQESRPLLEGQINNINNVTTKVNIESKCCSLCTIL